MHRYVLVLMGRGEGRGGVEVQYSNRYLDTSMDVE